MQAIQAQKIMAKVWSVVEAKSHLSEVLRLASKKPQYIGKKRPYVVVSQEQWEKINQKNKPMGAWLVQHFGDVGVDDLELPSRIDPPRKIPFQ